LVFDKFFDRCLINQLHCWFVLIARKRSGDHPAADFLLDGQAEDFLIFEQAFVIACIPRPAAAARSEKIEVEFLL